LISFSVRLLPHRRDRFRARFGHKNNRAAFESEGPPYFPAQIFFVRLGKKLVPVDEKQKGGRRLSDLRGIEKLQSASGRADRLAPLHRVQKCPIDNGGRDFLLQLRRDV